MRRLPNTTSRPHYFVYDRVTTVLLIDTAESHVAMVVRRNPGEGHAVVAQDEECHAQNRGVRGTIQVRIRIDYDKKEPLRLTTTKEHT